MAEAAKFNKLQRERRNRAKKEAEETAAPAKKRKVEKELRQSGREGRQAEREHRRSDKEARLLTREQRAESRERRQRLTKPIAKAAGTVLPDSKGTGSSTALGLGVAGVAALFITAGILKKSLGQVLEGDIGSKKTVEEEQREAERKSGTEITPSTEATSSEPEPKPETTPPNPFTIGPSLKHYHELNNLIKPAFEYKMQLEKEVSEHKLSTKEYEKQFITKYPKYLRWTKEFREVREQLEKIGAIPKAKH